MCCERRSDEKRSNNILTNQCFLQYKKWNTFWIFFEIILKWYAKYFILCHISYSQWESGQLCQCQERQAKVPPCWISQVFFTNTLVLKSFRFLFQNISVTVNWQDADGTPDQPSLLLAKIAVWFYFKMCGTCEFNSSTAIGTEYETWDRKESKSCNSPVR